MTALPTSLGDAPRRIGLTLPELQLAAASTGGAPLPFELAAAEAANAMERRLGATPTTAKDAAYRAALASLSDPTQSLTQRGLLSEGEMDAGVAGAIGLLAKPDRVLDLDIRVGRTQGRAWHRSRGGAVAMLSTIDGIVFELTWCSEEGWGGELGRIAELSDDVELTESAVSSYVDLPFDLLEAATEAIDDGRGDLVPVLVARYAGTVRGAEDAELSDAEVARVLTALNAEARGRLRALVGSVATVPTADDGAANVAGVVAWTLLADGWHALCPHQPEAEPRMRVVRVAAADLPTDLAPLLEEGGQ